MSTLMLVDQNQILLGAIFATTRKQDDVDISLIRHVFFRSIIALNKKFKPDDIVICGEGRSWRKDVYPHYKAHRKKGRDKSPYDFDKIFPMINQIIDEINEFMPWKAVSHKRAEADDIIGQIGRRHAMSGGKVVIVSSDHDFKQLHEFGNVVQWNPTMKKLVRGEPGYLKTHIIKGDSGDGIENILTDGGTLITEGKRQTPIRKMFLDACMAMHEDELIAHPDLSENYQRNRELIDLSYTPQDIKLDINKMYDEYDGQGDRKKVFNYFIKNKLKNLMGDINNV